MTQKRESRERHKVHSLQKKESWGKTQWGVRVGMAVAAGDCHGEAEDTNTYLTGSWSVEYHQKRRKQIHRGGE